MTPFLIIFALLATVTASCDHNDCESCVRNRCEWVQLKPDIFFCVSSSEDFPSVIGIIDDVQRCKTQTRSLATTTEQITETSAPVHSSPVTSEKVTELLNSAHSLPSSTEKITESPTFAHSLPSSTEKITESPTRQQENQLKIGGKIVFADVLPLFQMVPTNLECPKGRASKRSLLVNYAASLCSLKEQSIRLPGAQLQGIDRAFALSNPAHYAAVESCRAIRLYKRKCRVYVGRKFFVSIPEIRHNARSMLFEQLKDKEEKKARKICIQICRSTNLFLRLAEKETLNTYDLAQGFLSPAFSYAHICEKIYNNGSLPL